MAVVVRRLGRRAWRGAQVAGPALGALAAVLATVSMRFPWWTVSSIEGPTPTISLGGAALSPGHSVSVTTGPDLVALLLIGAGAVVTLVGLLLARMGRRRILVAPLVGCGILCWLPGVLQGSPRGDVDGYVPTGVDLDLGGWLLMAAFVTGILALPWLLPLGGGRRSFASGG